MKIPTWSPYAITIALNGLGFLGAFFIFYGTVTIVTRETWHPLEYLANKSSGAITIVATLIVSASVWFNNNKNPPSPVSTYFTSWIVVLACLAALAYLLFHDLPTTLVNGFAILGLSGSLFRILPLPYFGPPQADLRNSGAGSS